METDNRAEKIEPISKEECEILMQKANRDLSYAETLNSNSPTILEAKNTRDAILDIRFIKERIEEEI